MAQRVIFRQWPDGDLIAILPDMDANPYHVLTYMHIGQHGEGDYQIIVQRTRLVKDPAVYAELLAELRQIGYDNLTICKRLQRRAREDR